MFHSASIGIELADLLLQLVEHGLTFVGPLLCLLGMQGIAIGLDSFDRSGIPLSFREVRRERGPELDSAEIELVCAKAYGNINE